MVMTTRVRGRLLDVDVAAAGVVQAERWGVARATRSLSVMTRPGPGLRPG